MKKIVFCSDGTSNTQKDRTNVYRLFTLLKESKSLVKSYDRGVGTRLGNVLRGCAFGVGLHLNILDGFRFISRNYSPGDRIYLFGFSRGAYTVRSLASMISLTGLAPVDADQRQIKLFWKAYRKNREPEKFSRMLSCLDRREAPVEFVGVWDTVGSIGRQTRTKNIRKKLAHKYHRMTVYRNIHRICHAVSIDERRTQFYPHLLWQQVEDPEATAAKEVWFAGVHGDVGGCFCDDDPSLGNITLEWMISQVEHELDFHAKKLKGISSNPLGKMHNKEGGIIFSFFRKRNRPVRRRSVLHHSVLERISSPPVEYHQHREPTGNYCPLALDFCSWGKPSGFGIRGNYSIENEPFADSSFFC